MRSVCRARVKMIATATAIAAAKGTVQRKSTTSGRGKSGRSSRAREIALVFTPVQEPIPIETRDPIPAASMPGMTSSGRRAPPIPDASIIRTAAIRGEPNRNETAANIPAAATSVPVSGVASRFRSRMAIRPRPPPNAISGASGPSTMPRARVANAAAITPGSSIGWIGDALRPWLGRCPPCPGRRTIAAATSRPDSARSGTGHHFGVESNPRAPGRSSYNHPWASWTSSRNPQASSEAMTPSIDARMSSARN
jgi:hypothetical protein